MTGMQGRHGNHAKGTRHPRYKGRAAVRKTPMYRLWINIRNRCNNHNTPDYKYYGGKGVIVCVAWDSYEQFVLDVGPHPGGGLTLDRINTAGNYEPSNVRWATRLTQARNRPAYLKLSKTIADQIRAQYIRGVTRQVDIANTYGVTQYHISLIIRGRMWI